MSLSERARVEVYLPDLPGAIYQDLLAALTREFTYTFGGCTINRGLDGNYLSPASLHIQDRINLVYTDTPYAFEDNFEIISTYADKLKDLRVSGPGRRCDFRGCDENTSRRLGWP